MLVLVIAASHAIPPVVGGLIGKSKTTVLIGAAIGCAIAIASGSPAYLVADIVGVAFGTWLGFSMVTRTPKEGE